MSASFVILTTAVNSHGNAHRITSSDQGGGLLTDFHQAAPIVLFEHGFGNLQFPVLGLSRDKAGAYTVQKSPEKATATVYFDQHNPDAAAVFGMVESGTLGMASIGFNAVLVMEREQPAQRPLTAGVHQVGGDYRGVLFTETRLQEWSIVAQGADPGAVRQHLDKGSVVIFASNQCPPGSGSMNDPWSGGQVSTMALGEEGGGQTNQSNCQQQPSPGHQYTTLALGEEGGGSLF